MLIKHSTKAIALIQHKNYSYRLISTVTIDQYPKTFFKWPLFIHMHAHMQRNYLNMQEEI